MHRAPEAKKKIPAAIEAAGIFLYTISIMYLFKYVDILIDVRKRRDLIKPSFIMEQNNVFNNLPSSP